MQRGFSLMIETFTCALVLVARAQMARKALKRRAVSSAPVRLAPARARLR